MSNLRHGHNRTGKRSPSYWTWRAMLGRCLNSSSWNYKWYGGRGIKVCIRWRSFDNFIADMGERPEGRFLERKDNSKGYNKNNCTWATRKVQCNNRRKAKR